ncbi:MAG: pyridoxamine 5'-phosphate oxidase family protein [Actinomycetota bacterium]
MTQSLPAELEETLERGSFCHVAAETRHGPHLTPMVFVLSEGRVWVTTSRGSVKARSWRVDPRVGGMVRVGLRAVTFAGRAIPYDLLDAGTWDRAVRRLPALAEASIRFTRKNAKFFAGYAVDARHVPLAWTPPGRVFVEVEIERAAMVDGDVVRETWGEWEPTLPSGEAFRARRSGPDALAALPTDVRKALGRKGNAVLAVEGPAGAAVLPASWGADGPALYAALPQAILALAGLESPRAPVALDIDRTSWWRAKRMVGAMVRGDGEAFAVDRLRSGGKSAQANVRLTGSDPNGVALVRVRPERVVWWRGWSSGSARLS